MQSRRFARPAITLVTVLMLSAGIADAQTKIKAGFNLFSPQDDVNVGQQSAVQAEQQLPMLNDAQTNAYLNRIGQRLAANAGGPQFSVPLPRRQRVDIKRLRAARRLRLHQSPRMLMPPGRR